MTISKFVYSVIIDIRQTLPRLSISLYIIAYSLSRLQFRSYFVFTVNIASAYLLPIEFFNFGIGFQNIIQLRLFYRRFLVYLF